MFAGSANIVALAHQMRRRRLEEMRREASLEDEEEKKRNYLTFDGFMKMNSEKGFRELTNFNLNQFNELCELVRNCFQKAGKGNRTALTVEDRVFWLLCYLNTGGKIREICHMFQCSSATFHRNCNETCDLIYPVIKSLIPQSTTGTARRFANFPNAVGACDVCFIPIVRSRDYDEQKKYYSGKHKQHGFKLQAIVNADGICISTYYEQYGSVHDLVVFKNSSKLKMLEVVEGTDSGTSFVTHHPVLFDRGYTGVQKTFQEAVVAIRRVKGKELTKRQEEINDKIKEDRIIVENFFGRLKTLWGIVVNPMRMNIDLAMKIAEVCVALTNFHIKFNPLRAEMVAEEPSESDSEIDMAYSDIRDSSSQ